MRVVIVSSKEISHEFISKILGMQFNSIKKENISVKIKTNANIIANADLVLAFWDGKSVKTYDSINKARKANTPTIVYEM